MFLVLAACAGTPHQGKPTTGAIAGLVRDHDSGAPVAKALIQIRRAGKSRPLSTISSDRGLYDVHFLRPGRYELVAVFAGQPVHVTNIDVRANEVAVVDVMFTLGSPDPIGVDYGNTKDSTIDHYNPPNLGATVSIIEGTVNDTSTRERVAGAVITAVTKDHGTAVEQTISDDHGRFRFDRVSPGTYSVSAYYSVGGRGQIEVRRSEIQVDGAQAVVVPLWIEMVR